MTKRLKTPPKSNCQRVHEGRSSGPCINCKREEVTNRYWHLSQRRDQPLFYTFVKNAYAFKDDDCICRMCEARFRKSLEMSHDTEETSSKRKYDTAIDTSCDDSMTYTVIKMNNSMIKKKQNNQNHHVILGLFFFKFLKKNNMFY
jgi:hypothetical protein